MSGLIEILRNFCLSLPTKDEDTTRRLLHGVIGRGGFGPRMVHWLENSRGIFPETVRIEYPENINDRGVDVYVKGQQSRSGVGFQIKSDNDLRDTDFLPNLKRQITEARAYAELKLYVIVLACSPERYGRVQFALNEELNQWQAGVPEVLLLVPGKSASLYEACDTALTADNLDVLLRDRSWHRFFGEVGDDRDNEFLNHWSGLNPDERFATPDNLKNIEESLAEHPLTVIAGPPTIGKTFTAVQLLYRHFRSGHPVQWIKPLGQNASDFIVASAEAAEGFTYRVRAMARRLGMRPPDPPVSRWEFIAARLQPGAMILIEDPFGRTDAEYQNSIHTYDFFDLEGCIEAILKEGRDSGCRLFMTTRHGLLDRWLAQRSVNSSGTATVPRGMNIFHFVPDNYRSNFSKDESPLFVLAERLLRASGKADASAATSFARDVAERVKTPQEIELVIGSLPTPATQKAVLAALRETPPGALERIANLCRASNDTERLFLLMLMLTGEGHEHNDFATVYARLHTALSLPGDARADDAAARAKYWLIYYPHDYSTSNTLFTSGGVPLRWGVHLTASHPSVVEASRHEIIQNGEGFLNRLASALTRLEGYPQADVYKKMLVEFLVGFLIDESNRVEESRRLSEQALKDLAAALPSAIEISPAPYGSLADRLLRHWSRLPVVIQTAFERTVREGEIRLAAWICHLFRYMGVIDFDPWSFYDILARHNQLTMGVDGFTQPWHYFVSNLDKAPPHLRDIFDSMAANEPSRFAYVMGELASSLWQQFPQQWKHAILSDHATNTIWVDKAAALKNIYFGLFEGDVATPPSELLDLLWRYLEHDDFEFRAAAGIYVLVHWGRLTSRFHDALNERFRVEPEMPVLMEILSQGMSRKESSRGLALAEIILERGNEVAAAWLMELVRQVHRNEPNAESSAFVERCRVRAGANARAFELPDLESAEIVDELPLMRVAWLWKHVTGSSPNLSRLSQISVPILGERPPATQIRRGPRPPDPLIEAAPFLRDVARGLHGAYAVSAHYILSRQAQNLPALLQDYVGEVERGGITFTDSDISPTKDISEEVIAAVLNGRQDREAEQSSGRRSLPAFPIHSLGAAWR